MNNNSKTYQDIEAGEPVWVKPVREDKYGKIACLDDDELADPDELERQIVREEFEPILLLPKPKKAKYNPAFKAGGDIDFNAFASVDFDRRKPEFDKARYKADKLREQLKDLVIIIDMLNSRIKSSSKYRVLKLVKKGIMDVDDIADFDLWQMAKYYLRALRLKKEIYRLKEASFSRRYKAYKRWLDSL
jgi:hypothetical protein